MAETTVGQKKLRITWKKSAIGYSVKHKATIKALGLRRLHQSVDVVDSPGVRGMLIKVNHLVKIEEIS
jgi:large subunit ribosomal protein L30